MIFLLKEISFPSSTCNNIVHVDFTINSSYIFTSAYCCSSFMRVCMYECISETQARERVAVPGPWLDFLCRVCEKSRSSRSLRAAWGRSPTAKRPQRHIFSQNFLPEFNFSATTLRLHGGVTLVEHWRTVLISSWMTMSTHLTQGCFSLMICFFTIASNAMSGVNSPVLQREEEKKTWGDEKCVFPL